MTTLVVTTIIVLLIWIGVTLTSASIGLWNSVDLLKQARDRK